MPTTKPNLAQSIRTTTEALFINAEGKDFRIPWQLCSPALAAASESERLQAELSPGGYGIHWPQIDEDLSISGLLHVADTNRAEGTAT